MRVAIVGATGAVGRKMLRILEERRFPADQVVAFASERSDGVRLPFAGGEVTVRALSDTALEGVGLVLLSAGGEVARRVVPDAVAAGSMVIDNSSAYRMDPDVPLVIPEINPGALDEHRGIVANPNCTAIVALMALAPLHREAGLRALVTSSYQSVSGTGQKGIRELLEQVEKLRGAEEDLAHAASEWLPAGDVFGRTIAYNVLARCDVFEDDGFTREERKMGDEARKILGLPDLSVAATAVRVPVLVGHAVSIHARFDRAIDPTEARTILSDAPGVAVVDDPASDRYPTSLEAAGRDDVLVGRIRQTEPDTLLLFASGDNLRKGAALNAIQIAELLVRNP